MIAPALCRIARPLLLALLTLPAWSRGADAQQVVLLDQVVNPKRGTPDLQKSEYSVYAKDFANASPASLRSPVNYAEGNIHVRLEVLAKPSTVETLFTLCIHNGTQQTCIRYLPKYTKPGVYEYDQPMLGQYNYDVYDFAKPVTRVILALKDGSERLLDPSDPAFDSFFPTELRVTVALVAKGASYVTPMMPGDAGTAPPRDAGSDASAPRQDAAVPVQPDAGSSSSGGSSLILVDQRLTATAQSAVDSKVPLSLSPQAPASLRNPIDYGAGKLHARVEVFSKPSGAPTKLRACLESSSSKTLCTGDLGGQSYLSESAIDHEQDFASMPNASSYDFASPLRRVYLAVSDSFGASVAGSAQFFPSDLRVILTLVPPGSAYVPPWERSADGGSTPSTADAAAGAPTPEEGEETPARRDAGAGGADAGSQSGADAGRGGTQPTSAGVAPEDVFDQDDEGCALSGRRNTAPSGLAACSSVALALWLSRRRRR